MAARGKDRIADTGAQRATWGKVDRPREVGIPDALRDDEFIAFSCHSDRTTAAAAWMPAPLPSASAPPDCSNFLADGGSKVVGLSMSGFLSQAERE